MADQNAYGWFGHRLARGRRLSLRPIGPAPAQSVTWTAPLQLRYAALGAIQVLYAFACHLLCWSRRQIFCSLCFCCSSCMFCG